MKNVSRYRAMGSLHRQCAVLNPQQSWKHLGEAERWEHLAEAEISDYFRQCNGTDADEKSGVAGPQLRDPRQAA
jgi:hypothetical protein